MQFQNLENGKNAEKCPKICHFGHFFYHFSPFLDIVGPFLAIFAIFKILKLLEERMDIVREVGHIKSELDIPIEDKAREKEIIDRLSEHAGKRLTENQLIRIFRAVFKSSKLEQKKLD